jgi:hypothetical protein
MQEAPVNPQIWTGLYSFVSGLLIALIPYAVREYRNRKKSYLEDTETAARTEMTKVNTQSVLLRDNIAIGEGIGKILTDLIEAGDTIRGLQARVFELEQENIRFRMTKLSLKKAMALLAFHEISFSEADQPEIKKLLDRSR